MTIRRLFTQDPGLAELTSVSAIVIIDNAPPTVPLGAGTGVLCCVGEFESGPVETPTELVAAGDLERIFGGLGWATSTNAHAGPVAQSSGGNEAWNGNGYIHLANKRYNRLVVTRVDTSVGTVGLDRLASLSFGPGPFSAANGDQIVFRLNGGPTTTSATLDALPAVIDGVGAVFPLVSPGGKYLILSWDDTDPIRVTLADTDVLLADVIARINGRLAVALASDNGGQLRLTSVRSGSGARLQIHGGTALADLGLPTTIVADLWTLTVTADTEPVTEVQVSKIVDGVATDFVTPELAGPVGSVADKRDALLAQLQELAIPGHTFAASGGAAITVLGDPNEILTSITVLQGAAEVTVLNTTPGVALEVFGTGNVHDSSQFTLAEAVDMIDAAASISAAIVSPTEGRVSNVLTPGTGKIEALSGALLAALGFTSGLVSDAAAGASVTIPAGTRFQDSSAVGTIWVSTEAVETGTGGGTFSVKVRPFYDTDTAEESAIGAVTLILDTLPDGFAASNPTALIRLSAAQIDGRYTTAIASTLVDSAPANEINVITSARTSTSIIRDLVANCLAASAAGLAGRKTIVRPRLGVTLDQVFAYNDATGRVERKQLTFPGVRTVVSAIREVGSAGGIGFSDDGIVEVGSDIYLAALRTAGIRPEESAIQDPGGTNYGAFNAVGLEEAYDPATPGSTKLTIDSYKLLKARGVTATKYDRAQGLVYIDDVTSAEPSTGLTKANRRWFADFINDSLLAIGTPFRGKLITPTLRRTHRAQLVRFGESLKATDGTSVSRLADYGIQDLTDPSVPEVFRTAFAVQMYGTADTIVYSTTVGATVVVSEFAG